MSNPFSPPPDKTSERWAGSTLFPLLGKHGERAFEKGYLIPVAATIAASALLFMAANGAIPIVLSDVLPINRAMLIIWILAFYIGFLSNYFVFRMCGKDKPWWLICGVFVLTAFLMTNPVGGVIAKYNSFMWPGQSTSGFWGAVGPFLGPGLGEEFVKVLPVAALALLALFWRHPIASRIGVFEPLDGILIGVAAATAFALVETVSIYVPNGIYEALKPMIDFKKENGVNMPKFEVAELVYKASFESLIIFLFRSISEITTHLAWSGIFGYFIGLAVLRPGIAARVLIIGWLSAALLHGGYDAVGLIPADPYLIPFVLSVLSYAFLAAAILKGRALSPNRAQNFATRMAPHTPASTPPLQNSVPVMPKSVPQSAPSARSAGSNTEALLINIGTFKKTAVPGLQIEPQHLGSAGAGRGKDAIAEVIKSQTGSLALRNLSERTYHAKSDGASIGFERGQTIPLKPGLIIDFGGIEGTIKKKRDP